MPPVRKVNLSAHETHSQPYYPNVSAIELAKMKAEKERAAMEEHRKREQAKLMTQAAQQAQQQQLLAAQQQLQARQNQGQALTPGQQAGAQLVPTPIMPNQVLPQLVSGLTMV